MFVIYHYPEFVKLNSFNYLPRRIKATFGYFYFESCEFVFAMTAILGEKRLEFMLTMSELGSCYVFCSGCGNCDEEMEFGYFDFSERIENCIPEELPARFASTALAVFHDIIGNGVKKE